MGTPIVVDSRLGYSENFQNSLGAISGNDYENSVEYYMAKARHAQARAKQNHEIYDPPKDKYQNPHRPKLFVEITAPQGELLIEAIPSENWQENPAGQEARVFAKNTRGDDEDPGSIMDVLKSLMAKDDKPAMASASDHMLRDSFKEGEKIMAAWNKLASKDKDGVIYEDKHEEEPAIRPVDIYEFEIPSMDIKAKAISWLDREDRQIQVDHFDDEKFEEKHGLYNPDREKTNVVRLSHPEFGEMYIECANLDDERYKSNYMVPAAHRNLERAPSFTVEVNNAARVYDTPKHIEIIVKDTKSGNEMRLSSLNHVKLKDMEPKQHKILSGLRDMVHSSDNLDPMNLEQHGVKDKNGALIDDATENDDVMMGYDFHHICSVEIFRVRPSSNDLGYAESFQVAKVNIDSEKSIFVPCNAGAQEFFNKTAKGQAKAKTASKKKPASRSR